MFQVQCLKSEQNKPTEFSAKFCIEPLAKGQGITLGNALRRTLLSSIPGVAILGARIAGVDHEFSVVPGVKEDALEILLNLKQVIFKGQLQEPLITCLNIQGPGLITAEDIDLPLGVELVDKQQYIATVTTSTRLEIELLLEKGQNYTLLEKTSSNNPRGFLAVDAVFAPVKKVNFFVEVLNRATPFEKERLILEIQTNGSLEPLAALNYGAEILKQMFSFGEASITKPELILTEQNPLPNPKADVTNILIEELELSVRAYNCLKRAHIHTIGELLKYSKHNLLEFKNFGQKSADEVCENLNERFNLTLD
jgi:DNA-directed RNA polymerase subunit alpha